MKQIKQIVQEEITKQSPQISQTTVDLDKAKSYLLQVGQKVVSPDFNFGEREEMYDDLIRYFLGVEGKFKLNKGIILFGSVGTGKTTVMRVFQRAFRANPFKITSARHVARDCMSSDKPSQIIDEFGRHSYCKTQYGHIDHTRPINVCFDDVGAELESVKHYGNELPVIRDIIQDRYIEFVERGLITHFTTNLNAQAIEKKYDVRTLDRIKEMCTAIDMDGKSLRG